MAKETLPEKFDFHYIKSNGFRVVHADGVWGGPNLRGYITMSFFSERHPIPRRLTHEVKPDGKLGQEIDREIRDGTIREVEVEVMVDLAMAKSLNSWLAEKIQILENRHKADGKGN